MIRASRIVGEYEANEVAADARYKGKELAIIGVVGEIKKDILDASYVTLDDGEFGLRAVQAFFQEKDLPQLAQLRRGQIVAAAGRSLVMNVLLQKCRLIQLASE